MQDFTFISDDDTRRLVINGYHAVTQLELWDWLKSFEPNEGFMWSSHPNISVVMNKMETIDETVGHSGASFGFTMRHLEYIAKNGMEEYINYMNTIVNSAN